MSSLLIIYKFLDKVIKSCRIFALIQKIHKLHQYLKIIIINNEQRKLLEA